MRRAVVLLAILCLASLPRPASAADLQAGWYATIYSVHYYGYDANGGLLLVGDPRFLTAPGVVGVFSVTDEPYHWSYSRRVEVRESISGVGSGDSLSLPLGLAMDHGTELAYVDFMWETSYHPDALRLEFWRGRDDGSAQRLWQQPLPDHQFGVAQVAHNTVVEGDFFFRVSVVPECSSLAGLTTGLLGGLLGLGLRRRR